VDDEALVAAGGRHRSELDLAALEFRLPLGPQLDLHRYECEGPVGLKLRFGLAGQGCARTGLRGSG